MGYTIQYSTRICDAILSSPVPSPEFFTVHGSRLRFSVLPRATSLKMKLQCRSVGSLNEASKGPPFFSQFDPEIYWKYHGNIVQWDMMGYLQIYIYNLCMRYHGWLPNSTPVEGRGKRKPWVSTCFNMFQPSKGGAGFRKNPQLSTVHFSKQWLSGFST